MPNAQSDNKLCPDCGHLYSKHIPHTSDPLLQNCPMTQNTQSGAERRVKAVWPDAFALQFAGAWQIASASYGFPVMPSPGERIPRYLSDINCDTESKAWSSAASRLPEGKELNAG